MSQLTKLKAATSLADAAPLLGFKPSAISYILYKIPPSMKYKVFDIEKRYGGTRTICAPMEPLKLLQRRLSELLQNCVDEINERSGVDDKFVHGFKRRRSIVTNAKLHRSRRYVLNIDLSDFFGTINFGRVRGFFIKDQAFELDPKVATVLAQIACHENSLPQGSPCSPVIANLIGRILDVRLVRLAGKEGCTYSRYADDLSFSTNQRIFPKRIALDIGAHQWQLGSTLTNLVHMCGFRINEAKTRMQYRDSRQEVTGLVVNRIVNVRKEYRHKVRAMVHHLFTTGSFEIVHKWTDSGGARKENRRLGTLNQLHGMLGFIDSIDLYNRKLAARHGRTRLKKELMYLRFLLFKEFYATETPVIVCEGPTDNVYILHAVRSLASAHPRLATVAPDGSIALGVRIYKYAGTSTGRILGLTGGAARLAGFIHTYRTELRRFKAPGKHQPIILLVDNDSGSKPVYNAIKEVTGKKPTGSEAFVPVTANMYLVPIPPVPGKTSIGKTKIEDLFEPTVLATKIGSKTFHPGGDGFDDDKHYGKTIFAHKVIRVQADRIDFGGFSTLLANISAVIKEHAKLHPISKT